MIRRGSNAQLIAESHQDRCFERLMYFQEEKVRVRRDIEVALRVSMFEILKSQQPAAAWAMGYMAGWPEMRPEQ